MEFSRTEKTFFKRAIGVGLLLTAILSTSLLPKSPKINKYPKYLERILTKAAGEDGELSRAEEIAATRELGFTGVIRDTERPKITFGVGGNYYCIRIGDRKEYYPAEESIITYLAGESSH